MTAVSKSGEWVRQRQRGRLPVLLEGVHVQCDRDEGHDREHSNVRMDTPTDDEEWYDLHPLVRRAAIVRAHLDE